MEFGPKIEINGTRPGWLENGVRTRVHWNYGHGVGEYPSECISGWECSISAIQVHADHPIYAGGTHYVRLEDDMGFTAGKVYKTVGINVFDDDGDNRAFFEEGYRLATPAEIEQYEAENQLEAAYRGGLTTPEDDAPVLDDTPAPMAEMVSLPMMTTAEAVESNLDVRTLIKVGAISDASIIDRFDAHHGGLDDNQRAIVDMFIAWQNS